MGEIIEEYATEEAIVKVGTAIDPDMRDELHVTVVVTGLNSRVEKPVKVVDNTVAVAQAADAVAGTAVAGKVVGEQFSSDYSGYDKPTYRRNAAASATPQQQEELDYLDIPAFLRRQAD